MKDLYTTWRPHLATIVATGLALVALDLTANAQTAPGPSTTPAIAGVVAAGSK